MQYHRGLLHQRGHGWGALAKIAAKVAAPVVAQVVGGLLGGAQTGQGIQKGHGMMDSVLNAAIMANHIKHPPITLKTENWLRLQKHSLVEAEKSVSNVDRKAKDSSRIY